MFLVVFCYVSSCKTNIVQFSNILKEMLYGADDYY